MSCANQVLNHPVLKRYFRFLRVATWCRPLTAVRRRQLIQHRDRLEHLEIAWRTDEFAIDPTRATLAIGATGMDGDTFKNKS